MIPTQTSIEALEAPPEVTHVASESAAVASESPPARDAPRATIVAPAVVTPSGSRLIPIAVGTALLMEFVDSTALSTALPTLARSLHSDPVHLKLALTSYLLALAVGVPASGWMADRFGARRVFVAAMTVFLGGSMMCGLSHSLTQLVVARLVQGAGGAMMTPVGRLIVVGSSPRERLVASMTWFTTPAMIGPLLGPPLAGLILGAASWPWILFVNVPVGVIGIAAVVRYVPKLKQDDPGRFDTTGFVLSALTIIGVVVLAEVGGVNLVPPWVQLTIAAALAASLALYIRHAATTARPILDLTLFRHASFRGSLLGATFVRLGLGATPLLLPLLLQVGLGWSPEAAGMFSVLTAIGAIATKPVIGRVIRRFGFRTVLFASALLTAVTTAAPALLATATPFWLIAVALVLGGLARSTQFTAANTLAYADAARSEVSGASTLATVVQQVGLSLGVSYGGLVLHLARGRAADSVGALTPSSFVVPFILVGMSALLALPVYWRLSASAGSGLSPARAG